MSTAPCRSNGPPVLRGAVSFYVATEARQPENTRTEPTRCPVRRRIQPFGNQAALGTPGDFPIGVVESTDCSAPATDWHPPREKEFVRARRHHIRHRAHGTQRPRHAPAG